MGVNRCSGRARCSWISSATPSMRAPAVTTEAAADGGPPAARAAPIWWKRRLTVVRSFARHLKTLDAACQVPHTALLLSPTDRVTPYLFPQERNRGAHPR